MAGSWRCRGRGRRVEPAGVAEAVPVTDVVFDCRSVILVSAPARHEIATLVAEPRGRAGRGSSGRGRSSASRR